MTLRFTLAAVLVVSFASALRAQDAPERNCFTWNLGTDADLDQTKVPHFAPVERIGERGEQDGIVFRWVKPAYQVLMTVPAFDFDAANHGAVNHPFYLAVKFKDVAKQAITVCAGKGGCGFYGAGYVGTFGGAGDGQWKEETIIIPRSMMRSSDGKTFTLKFTETKVSVPVASLTLFSADTQMSGAKEKIAAAEKFHADKREALRKSLLPQYKDLGLPDPGPCPEYTAEEKARGFRVFFPPISRQLFANSQPLEGELTNEVKLFACPGQTVCVVVALRSLEEAGATRVRTEYAMKNMAGPDIRIQPIRWAVYSEQRIGSSWGKDYRVCPEQLVVRDSQDVRPDRLEIAALTIDIPEGFPLSRRDVGIRVTSSKGKTVLVPVSLMVYPFRMERPAHSTHGQFYYAQAIDFDPFEIEDMAEHGMDTMVAEFMPGYTPGPKGELDWDAVRKGWAMAKQWGYRSPMITGTGNIERLTQDPAKRADYVRVVAETIKVAKEFGFTDLGFFPVDEPHDAARQQQALKSCTWIKDAPGANTYITSNPKAVPVLDAVLNYVCYNLTYLNAKTIASMKPHQTLMFYCPSFDVNPEGNRYRAGFYQFRIGAFSSQYFAYMEFAGDPFCDLDGPNRDWNVVYPSMTSPTHDPTLEWEALREGVYDYRYLWTLKATIDRAKAKGKVAEAAKAQAVLDEVLAAVDVDGNKTGGPELAVEADTRLKDRKLDPNELAAVKGQLRSAWYDESRRKIAQAIMDLKRALGE